MKNNTNEDLQLREKYINAFVKYKHILTTNQIQIFHLYYIEDLSLAEISEIVATTRSAVFDCLSTVRKKLKPFLNI